MSPVAAARAADALRRTKTGTSDSWGHGTGGVLRMPPIGFPCHRRLSLASAGPDAQSGDLLEDRGHPMGEGVAREDRLPTDLRLPPATIRVAEVRVDERLQLRRIAVGHEALAELLLD